MSAVIGTKTKSASKRAFTLIEVMLAIVVLAIAVIGTSAYRYHVALGTRQASLKVNAAHVALLLCEAWRGAGADPTYDPHGYFNADMTISNSDGPPVPFGFTTLGSYSVVLDGVNYYVTMSYDDVAAELRALNITVGWDSHGVGDGAQAVNTTYNLTTYVGIE